MLLIPPQDGNNNGNPSGGTTDSGIVINTQDGGTFTELQEKINSAYAGSTIILKNDYKPDDEFVINSSRHFDGVEISKSLTIDGNGHTITGSHQMRTSYIFTITTNNPVTLKNIVFTHGARAITAVGNLNIINCTFTNNAIFGEDGGAVYCSGKLTVENSNFKDNTALYFGDDVRLYGGAIICGKGSTISNSIFEDNTASRGSAVSGFNPGDVTLTKCTLYKNYIIKNGGFYYLNILINNGNAENCRFIGYKSTDNVVNGKVSNCIFDDTKTNNPGSKKATPKLTAKSKTFKKSIKTKKYSVPLKNNAGKAMKNIKLTLKLNKKTYSAKTNSKGVATFKITKLTKKGKFTATVKFAGNANYNAVTQNVKITVR